MKFVTVATTLVSAATLVSADDLSFLTLGDWGKHDFVQRRVASVMGQIADVRDVSFVVALGDNFYQNGVTDVDDPQWNSTFENTYTQESLQVPWISLLGNHDHNQNASAQIAKVDDRFQMDDYHYVRHMQFEDSNTKEEVTVDLVMLDTVILCPDSTMKVIKDNVENGEVEQEVADSWEAQLDELYRQADNDWGWVNATLASSTSDWLFVAGHYPIYSAGEHGNTEELLDNLLPLLSQYDADAYFNGHDHILQHLYDEGSDMHMLGSGAGAKLGEVHRLRSKDQLVWGEARNGFMHHFLNSTNMHVSMFNHAAEELYNYNQARKVKRTG